MSYPTPPPSMSPASPRGYETDIEYDEDEEVIVVPRNLLPQLYQVARSQPMGAYAYHSCQREECLLCLSRRQ